MADGSESSSVNGWMASTVSIGKDLVSLLRDATLFLLAVLLVVFPARFNDMLSKAGFEEGNFVGFTWRSKLVESNHALEDAQATIADLQKKNDELVKALSDANPQIASPALKQDIARLETENRSLKLATARVQNTVSQTLASNAPLVERAQQSAQMQMAAPRPNSDFSVGVQTLGAADSERQSINSTLSTDGYGLDDKSFAYPANQKPSWFAAGNTVFYYSSSSASAARKLAQRMEQITGRSFAVQRGSGLGVDPDRRDSTLFVHYLKG